MNKKIFVVVLISILLVGIVVAGNLNKEKKIDKVKKDKITEKANKYREENNLSLLSGDLIISVGDAECDIDTCWFKVKLDGVINQKLGVPARECNSYDNETSECLDYTTFTDKEIREFVDVEIQNKLDSYASALIERETKTVKNNGGDLVIKNK